MNRSLSLGPLRVYAYHDYQRTDAPDHGPLYIGAWIGERNAEVMV